MIKRRFYKQDHGDKDVPSDSSSSSDSELEAESSEDEIEEKEDDEAVVAKVRHNNGPCSSSSGYESEDSSAHEVDLDSSGSLSDEDALENGEQHQDIGEKHSSKKRDSGIVDMQGNDKTEKDEIPSDVPDFILKAKSVFKCKLCPRIVCLSEETLRAHLKSKRHIRSEKLLSEGRLKFMLNSDGEIETIEGEETHQERYAATLAAAQSCQNLKDPGKKNKGRQRQRKRVKKKTGEDLTSEDMKSAKKPPKKKRKSNNPGI